MSRKYLKAFQFLIKLLNKTTNENNVTEIASAQIVYYFKRKKLH